MLLQVPDVLSAAQLAECRRMLEAAPWVDGRVTAGFQSAAVKNNGQVPEDHPAARELGGMVVSALGRAPLFVAAALPSRIFPPLFNRYEGGQSFGTHVDNAIRQARDASCRIRCDLSATLFLNAPEEYDGGELVVEDSYGAHSVKLPAGHMALYPAGSLHRVSPVTSGARLAAFFWIQSMVRDDGKRSQLFDLDVAIQQLARDVPDHPATVQLVGVYHNLVRAWAEV
jgi:PKHD-type hydroxylase